jgi:hypothetical protein
MTEVKKRRKSLVHRMPDYRLSKILFNYRSPGRRFEKPMSVVVVSLCIVGTGVMSLNLVHKKRYLSKLSGTVFIEKTMASYAVIHWVKVSSPLILQFFIGLPLWP